MPKPNQTMLDKLAETFKSVGKGKPGIIQQTAWRDPLGYTMEQRRFFGRHPDRHQKLDMTPEREVYQAGVDTYQRKLMDPILKEQRDVYDEQAGLQDEFEEAYEDARERWMSDVEDAVPSAPEMEYGFDPSDLEYEAPSFDLRDYWPSYADDAEEFAARNEEQLDRLEGIDKRLDYYRGPKGRMRVQTMTPRYRNYRRAMQQREDNAQLGRVNAAIMNLYRQGYSMPEIREILRNRRIR